MIKVKKVDVQWLESIPESWRLLKLKFLCDINTGSRDTQDKLPDGKYPFFVRSPHVEGLNEFSHDEEAVMTAGDGVGVGKVFHYYDGKFAAHQRVYVFTKFKNIKGKYLYYYLMSNLKFEVLMGGAKSTVDSIRRPMLSEFPIAFPSLVSQEKIIRFLDVKEAQINSLIESKEKYFSLLEQQRQSIITEAVTKGLNPNVKMKDSGVEWIGEIPEHFEKTLIKYISDINMGQSPSSEDVNVLGDGLPFLQGNAEFGEFYPTPKLFSTSINKQSKLNDILLSVRAPVGAMNISNQIFGIGRGLCSITPKIEMKFLWYWLIGYNEYLKSFSTGSTFEAISIDDIKNFVICVPEKNEQLEIVCFLDYKIGQIDNVKKQLKLQIQKLKEYRQSLIYEAVTGKIDVREMEREVSEVSEDGCGYIGEGV
ncbi:MAG: restriction endonuclease subunit S [Exiguobacterium mexicanum]